MYVDEYVDTRVHIRQPWISFLEILSRSFETGSLIALDWLDGES